MDPESEHRRHGNSLANILSGWSRQQDGGGGGKRNVLALNVLLLGDRQSGRSSVGNALIGGHEFQTGTCVPGVSVTTEFKVLRRTFPGYFRRQGAESDLLLRVIDTPPLLLPEGPQSVHALCPEGVHELCPGGVHVVVLVVRADVPKDTAYVERCAESIFGPDWRHHALIVLTHADHLKKVGLNPPGYQTEAADWPGALSSTVVGGVLCLDNSSCDWPSITGRPLRDRLLDLSARNHHRALKVHTEASL